MTSALNRYQEALSTIPAPGDGCHTALLGVANHGIRAGISETQLFQDIRNAIPYGKRRIPDREISEAIRKAGDCSSFTPMQITKTRFDDKAALRRIIKQSRAKTEVDLWELSDRIDWEPEEDSWRFLSIMFEPDLIFIGDRHEPGIVGETIRPVKDWIQFFQSGGEAGPFILVNPLTGKPAPKKSGDGATHRGDGCIASYRYALAEFDNLSFETQIAFWTGARLPIKALVHSGGKSIHAWLRVDIADADAWDHEIKDKLYRQALIPIGIDSACSNPARLARLPGCKRGDNWQKLLYFKGSL